MVMAMDYEKAYKEALERAGNLHKDAIDMGENLRAKQCEIIFPELLASKDERIRKGLITIYRDIPLYSKIIDDIRAEDIIKWLEKQGEQKPYGQRQECIDCQFNYAGECKGYCTIKKDEQKSADKVEPKFKKD